jgi:hypothetical protein
MIDYLKIATTVVSEVSDLVSQRQNDAVNDSLASMDGIVLEDVELLSASSTDVWHHLGTHWSQYEVLKRSNGATVYHTGAEADPTKSIQLKSSSNVTVTLRIR